MPLQTDAKLFVFMEIGNKYTQCRPQGSLLFYADDNEATATTAINNLASQSLHPTSATQVPQTSPFNPPTHPSPLLCQLRKFRVDLMDAVKDLQK
jgi:hypothetical protein